jgi:hypothetical protein
MDTSLIQGRLQKNISQNLPIHLCFYILQFCDELNLVNVLRCHINTHYLPLISVSNNLYLHSKVSRKVYPTWRLVSKYYYFIDSNSSCNFCIGRYKYTYRNLRCNNCGHVNNLKYFTNDWKSAFQKRQEQIDKFKESNAEFTLLNDS